MCGFIAQLVEHRTGTAEVTGSNPAEALILFRRIEVLHEIALRLRELSVLPPCRASVKCFVSSEHFQQ